ncbi:hypothetical protein K413DRAFT_0286 [Clostridium sp. ASBs410]|nr:hypothetical protein K413DRAFT_0286 [Clostridium sp. ASBs410]
MRIIVLVIGTKKGVIKMYSLVNQLKRREHMKIVTCMAGQHQQILDPVLDAFDVKADYGFPSIKEETKLFDVTINILDKVKQAFREERAVRDLVNENIILKAEVRFEFILGRVWNDNTTQEKIRRY